jgi:hypothetical protein
MIRRNFRPSFFAPSLFKLSLSASLACAVACASLGVPAAALAQAQQPQEKPLTSQELVKLLYELPGHPERRDAVIGEIRRRGIGFELTTGMRSLAATKSGNDSLLRRTLEEAARRRANPAEAVRPSEAEAREVLQKAREATREAVGAMPDFVVKQLISRSHAYGTTRNWQRMDNLTVAVSYRESEGGERYRLLAVNGLPTSTDERERATYERETGATSTGEFVMALRELFSDEAKAEFRAVDTDTLRGRRAILYEYEVKLDNSKRLLSFAPGPRAEPQIVRVAHRGRVWIDREAYRVLRVEVVSTDIPRGFPITAAVNTIDYDWVTIAERRYLLPVRAEVEMTTHYDGRVRQTYNEIRFRNYQKFGTEVKILEDDDFPVEEPPKRP